MKTPSDGKLEKPFVPWACFLAFLVTHSILTYLPLSPVAKWLCLALGFLLPFYAAFKTLKPHPSDTTPLTGKDLWSYPSCWVLFLGIFLCVFLRFYKLGSLFRWPTSDEGWNGILAIALSHHCTWRFFYPFGQAPPLPVWTTAGLWKLGFSPFLCLWLPSAVVSVLTVFAGYFAAREFFSKTFSLLCGALMAFSFWPLYLGRFCHQGIWLAPWFCACLFLLGRVRNAEAPNTRNMWAAVLGVATGLGSFTFTPWSLGAALLAGTVGGMALSHRKKNTGAFLCFSLSLSAALVPFFLAVVKESYGAHIQSVASWGEWGRIQNQAWVVLGYLASFFWGPLQQGSAYTPTGGGFLNPILGSLFLLGFLESLRLAERPWVRWVFFAFGVLLLPGFLSINVETFRVAQVLPFLIFFTALGLQFLLSILPSGKRTLFLFLVLIPSLGLDASRLGRPYGDDSQPKFPEVWPVKSMERYRAFRLLSSMARWRGPGLIFTHFEAESFFDPTLSVMAYPWNAAENPGVALQGAKWAAVFVNAHYAPFLSVRFPEAKWFYVGEDLETQEKGKALGIIPVTAKNQGTLRRWAEAHVFFQRADLLRFWQDREDFKPVIRSLEKGSSWMEGDPFLKSVYWEKMAAYEYEVSNYGEHLHALQQALREGYPSAHLHYQLGLLLMAKNRYVEARQALQAASRCAFNRTPSEKTLKVLEELNRRHWTLGDLYRQGQ